MDHAVGRSGRQRLLDGLERCRLTSVSARRRIRLHKQLIGVCAQAPGRPRRARRPGSSCRARGACGSLRPGRTRGPRSACCPRRTAGSGSARRTGKPGLSRRPRGAGKSVSARGSRGSRKSGFSRGTCRAGRTRRPGCARRTCGAGKSGSSCGAGRPGDRTDLLTWYAAARNTPLAMTIHRNDPLPFKCFPAHAMCPEIHAFRLCPLREGINARSGRGLPSSWTRTGRRCRRLVHGRMPSGLLNACRVPIIESQGFASCRGQRRGRKLRVLPCRPRLFDRRPRMCYNSKPHTAYRWGCALSGPFPPLIR